MSSFRTNVGLRVVYYHAKYATLRFHRFLDRFFSIKIAVFLQLLMTLTSDLLVKGQGNSPYLEVSWGSTPIPKMKAASFIVFEINPTLRKVDGGGLARRQAGHLTARVSLVSLKHRSFSHFRPWRENSPCVFFDFTDSVGSKVKKRYLISI